MQLIFAAGSEARKDRNILSTREMEKQCVASLTVAVLF